MRRESTFQLAGIDIRGMDVHNGTSKFDIGMFMVEKPEGLLCSVEYSTDLFDATTIQRLLGHYRVLLEAIVEDPDLRIGELPMLPTEEERQLVVGMERHHRGASPRDRCIHELVRTAGGAHTRHTRQWCSESSSFTYRELNQRANQLAHKLRELGVGPEDAGRHLSGALAGDAGGASSEC